VQHPSLAESAHAAADGVLAEAVRHAGDRLRKRIHGARAEGAAEALHEVRKAAKRVRYTAEVAAPVRGKHMQDLAAAMKQVQDTLGERQDTVVTLEQCRTLGSAAHAAGEDSWTYGRLHALEQARADRTEAAYRALEPATAQTLRRATKS
jgi:CHAD domain-containing protein